MKRLQMAFVGVVFAVCSSLSAQSEVDKKFQALEKKLTAEQKRLLNDWVDVQFRMGTQFFDAKFEPAPQSLVEVREWVTMHVTGLSAAQAKVFWRDLPYQIRRDARRLNPLHVSAEERTAADALPPDAKKEVAKLLSDKIDEVLAARRKVLAYGPAARALVVDQMLNLPANSAKGLRLKEVVAKLEFEEAHERRLRATEAAYQKADALRKAQGKSKSTVAVLVARRLCEIGGRGDSYGELAYYNFKHSNYDYTAGVGLEYGNGSGDRLQTNCYGGQDNRLKSLGALSYADVKKAPGPGTTAKWEKRPRDLRAVVGHVYLLHLVDERDEVDFCVKFRVVDMSPEEWIIIEWERIEQEK